MDLFDKCYARTLQDDVREQGLYPYFHALESRQDVTVMMEGKRRIMLGTYVLSSGYYDAYYKRAKMLQRLIGEEFDKAFTQCDVLVTPTTPTTAFRLGEKTNDPLAMYASDICTTTANIAGLPGVSVPCGFDAQGLPIGMQLLGPKWSESKLLGVAKCYETAVGGFAVKEM